MRFSASTLGACGEWSVLRSETSRRPARSGRSARRALTWMGAVRRPGLGTHRAWSDAARASCRPDSAAVYDRAARHQPSSLALVYVEPVSAEESALELLDRARRPEITTR